MEFSLLKAEGSHKSLLDPRTKVLSVLTVALLSLSAGSNPAMEAIRLLLAAVPAALLLSERSWRLAATYSAAIFAALSCERLLLPMTHGIASLALMTFCGIFGRFLPGIAMGLYLVSTTTVSEFMCAMQRLHIPQVLTIPVAVVFRFFPTLGEEYEAIGDAMRMRGIGLWRGSPLRLLEYRLVPLMSSCVRIGDELSAAALTRGLGSPVRRTNLCRIGFGVADVVACALCASCVAAFALSSAGLLGG